MKFKVLIALTVLVTSLSASAHWSLGQLLTIGIFGPTIVGVQTTIEYVGSSSLSASNKEQIEAVRSDALDFLAGLEASDALVSAIDTIRAEKTEALTMSDEEIAGAIVEAIQ